LSRLSVDLRLSTPATPALVAAHRPDVLVLATGGTGFRPPIPGSTLPRVTDLRDRPADFPPAATVTVWGADRAGLAVADAIAATGQRVLLLAAGPELAPEAGPREKVLAVRRLTSNPDVTVRLDTTLEAIEESRLLIGHRGDRQWLDVPGPVLVSQGTVPRVTDPGPGPWRTVVVGEAGLADSAADAIRQGTEWIESQ
jgi:NADPH-dependent 2,4-dienoyl-CoA reductase/sulfur reductase-like enzyme